MKECLCQSPPLAHPDFKKTFILDTDATDVAIGAVLSQVIDGQERVIAYASKSLSKTGRKYCVTRKELYALVYFVNYFRHYLYGRKFTARTDHASLKWLVHFKNPEGQVARLIELLSSLEMDIIHRPGKVHRNADGMSRRQCRQCGRDMSELLSESQKENADVCLVLRSIETETIDLKTAQKEDRDLNRLREWLENKEKPKVNSLGSESHYLKSLVSQWNRLEIRERIVSRRWNILKTDLVNWQGIVPLKHRRNVLKYAHDIKASGHLGISKTIGRIRKKFYWPALQS